MLYRQNKSESGLFSQEKKYCFVSLPPTENCEFEKKIFFKSVSSTAAQTD